jgi:hypothetical protein
MAAYCASVQNSDYCPDEHEHKIHSSILRGAVSGRWLLEESEGHRVHRLGKCAVSLECSSPILKDTMFLIEAAIIFNVLIFLYICPREA